MHVVYPLRASPLLLQIDIRCSRHDCSIFSWNHFQGAFFRSSGIALAVPFVLPACANTPPCMRPSRTNAFSCRESEQAAAHTSDRPRNHPAGPLWGPCLLPYFCGKGLHSIHRQVKNSADSLVSLSHGSQSPNFLLLFLCHCPAPPLFFKQSSKSCPTPSRRDSRRERHASHLQQWRCVQRWCPVQQRTVWHTASRCLRGY